MWTRGAGIKTPGRAKLISQFQCMYAATQIAHVHSLWTIPWAVSLRNHTVGIMLQCLLCKQGYGLAGTADFTQKAGGGGGGSGGLYPYRCVCIGQ